MRPGIDIVAFILAVLLYGAIVGYDVKAVQNVRYGRHGHAGMVAAISQSKQAAGGSTFSPDPELPVLCRRFNYSVREEYVESVLY